MGKSADIKKLGMFADGLNLYDDEMRTMEQLTFEKTLASPISTQAKTDIDKAILSGDIKILKNFLN